MSQLAVGNFVTFSKDSIVQYRFQNFYIGETATYAGENYGFLAFAFSGITVNRTGDNIEASLFLPNNELSRSWALEAMDKQWLAHVRVMLLDLDDRSSFTQLHQYYGVAAAGTWSTTDLQITLSTILDAVGADVPVRRLTQRLIGSIPVTNNVSLR